jgi:hypothetical protein
MSRRPYWRMVDELGGQSVLVRRHTGSDQPSDVQPEIPLPSAACMGSPVEFLDQVGREWRIACGLDGRRSGQGRDEDLQIIDVPGLGEELPHQRPRRRYLAPPQQDLRLVRRGADALVAAAVGALLRDHLVG